MVNLMPFATDRLVLKFKEDSKIDIDITSDQKYVEIETVIVTYPQHFLSKFYPESLNHDEKNNKTYVGIDYGRFIGIYNDGAFPVFEKNGYITLTSDTEIKDRIF